MAIINIKEGWSETNSGGTWKQATTLRIFTILTDAPQRPVFLWPVTNGSITIPAPGGIHPDLPNYFSNMPQVQTLSPYLFKIRVPYETPDGSNQYEDPLEKPMEISWDSSRRSVPYDKDMDGNALVNTLKKPFDPPPIREVFDIVLRLRRNEASFSSTTLGLYLDTIATGAFWGYAAGRSLMVNLKAQSTYQGSVDLYWNVDYEVHIRIRTPTGVSSGQGLVARAAQCGLYL